MDENNYNQQQGNQYNPQPEPQYKQQPGNTQTNKINITLNNIPHSSRLSATNIISRRCSSRFTRHMTPQQRL